MDLRPGAENPTTPTRLCGAVIVDAAADDRHMASAHPQILRLFELLAEIAVDRVRARE